MEFKACLMTFPVAMGVVVWEAEVPWAGRGAFVRIKVCADFVALTFVVAAAAAI